MDSCLFLISTFFAEFMNVKATLKKKSREFIFGIFFSAETQNRTVDTTIFSRMLYQLSYLGKPLFLNNVLYSTRVFVLCQAIQKNCDNSSYRVQVSGARPGQP